MYTILRGSYKGYNLHFGLNRGQWVRVNGKLVQRDVTTVRLETEGGYVVDDAETYHNPADVFNKEIGRLNAIKNLGGGLELAQEYLYARGLSWDFVTALTSVVFQKTA